MATFEDLYPALSRWATTQGWIEVGLSDAGRSPIRVLDEGGVIWEGRASYPSLDDALRDAELAVTRWMQDQLGERRTDHCTARPESSPPDSADSHDSPPLRSYRRHSYPSIHA